MTLPTPVRVGRFILFGAGGFALIVGLLTGLVRMGWQIPPSGSVTANHGPLMVCGFLGSLISLERAVALGKRWAFLAPIFTGVGSLLLVFQPLSGVGPGLIVVGSVLLCIVYARVLTIQFVPFTIVMSLGAVSWLVGNLVWATNHPIFAAVPLWIAFLLLTIGGERLELSRMVRLSSGASWMLAITLIAFIVGASIWTYGVFLSAADITSYSQVFGTRLMSPVLQTGGRLMGAAMVGLGLWLSINDIARRTVRLDGLPKFIATALLAGFIWLIVSGGFMLIGGPVTAGLYYDAVLHAFFLGFVISMVFAHAPVIFPSVFGGSAVFNKIFYFHLALLHGSLLLRVVSDLIAWSDGRMWGGMLNAIAILLFIPYHALAKRTEPESKALKSA